MGFLKKIWGSRKKKKRAKRIRRINSATDMLRLIDDELALNVEENMVLAYGNVSYGFGVSSCGGLYVMVCDEDVITKDVKKIDEFIIDVDFTMDKRSLLDYLIKEINAELLTIHLSNIYMDRGVAYE